MSKRKPTHRLTAKHADKYDLYLRSVQEPVAEVDFFDRVFRAEFKRKAVTLREDFCAAAAVCCEWVRRRPANQAVGVDLDPEPLEWARMHNLPRLTPDQQQRVSLVREDVRKVSNAKADIVAAENFSFFLFKTRHALREYFQAAHANLAEHGLLVTDMMGGPAVLKENEKDYRKIKIEKGTLPGITPSDGVEADAAGQPVYGRCSFEYIWEQESFNPISHHGTYHIHFRFKDRTKIKRAFSYDWRLWTIPEVRELMLEAGFKRADVYWEGEDKHGEGDGIYRRREKAGSDNVWIAYVVGVK